MSFQTQGSALWSDQEAQVDAEALRCRQLWAESLRIAIEDARGTSRYVSRPAAKRAAARAARSWLADEGRAAGSFEWVCAVLDLDAGRVRAIVLGPGRGARRAH